MRGKKIQLTLDKHAGMEAVGPCQLPPELPRLPEAESAVVGGMERDLVAFHESSALSWPEVVGGSPRAAVVEAQPVQGPQDLRPLRVASNERLSRERKQELEGGELSGLQVEPGVHRELGRLSPLALGLRLLCAFLLSVLPASTLRRRRRLCGGAITSLLGFACGRLLLFMQCQPRGLDGPARRETKTPAHSSQWDPGGLCCLPCASSPSSYLVPASVSLSASD